MDVGSDLDRNCLGEVVGGVMIFIALPENDSSSSSNIDVYSLVIISCEISFTIETLNHNYALEFCLFI